MTRKPFFVAHTLWVWVFGLGLGCLGTPALAQQSPPPNDERMYTISPVPASPQAKAKEKNLIADVVNPELTFDLEPNQSKLIRTKSPVLRISITNPDIAEVLQFSPTELELIGKKSGHTTMTLWFEHQNQTQVLRYLVRVASDELAQDQLELEYGRLQDRINELFPNSFVQLIPVADKIIVRGQARDSEEAAQILAIVSNQLANQQGGNLWYFNAVGAGDAAPAIAGQDLPSTKVINLLDVPGEKQVMLKVRIAEVSRTALRRFGNRINVTSGDFSFNTLLGLTDAAGSVVLNTEDVFLALDALSSQGYAKILAEPTLVALNGRPASFIAGGEFAVPTVVGVQGVGAATTTFRGFGTQLTFIPTIIDKDRVRLQVIPSFSTLNDDNTVDGIPGLDTRAVFTTVELREGQWLAIAGLIKDQQEGNRVGLPFVESIPVLNALFTRKSVQRDETELIVLVSPELVHPLEPEDVSLLLPGADLTEPDDWTFYVHGWIEGDPNCQYRSTVWPRQQQAYHKAKHQALIDAKHVPTYQVMESHYVQGPCGFSD